MQTRQHERESTRIEPIPDAIDSAQAKLVYLYLQVTGGTTVDDLSPTLAMQKLAALSVLNALSSAGLVERDGGRYVVAN